MASKARTALFFAGVSRPFIIVIMAAGSAVLSRLLDPTAFGMFTMAMAIFLVAEQVCLLGLPTLLTKTERLEDGLGRAAAGVLLSLASVSLLIAVITGAVLRSSGAGEVPEAVAWLTALLIAGLLVQAWSVPFEAQLHRRLEFGFVSLLTVARAGIDVAVAVILALQGFGPYALAIGVLSERVLGAVLLIIIGRGRARIFRPSWRGWSELRSFGGLFTASHAVGIAGRFGVTASLGGILGTAGLGFFNRAETIPNVADKALLQGIRPVMMPLFARELRAGTPPARIYEEKTNYLAIVLWPVFGAMILLADDLVRVLLGEQWGTIVPAARILLVTGFIIPFVRMTIKLFAAIDRLDAYLRIALLHQPIRLGLLIPAAAFFGLEAAAAALVTAGAIRGTIILGTFRRLIDLRLTRLLPLALRALMVTVVVLCAAAGPLLLLGEASPFLRLPVTMAACGAGWLAGAALLRHPILGHMLALGASALGRGSAAEA